LKANDSKTQTTDQFSASLTVTLCAPCFLSTTKSMNSAAMTAATKKAHSQAGAMVSMDTPEKFGLMDRAEKSCGGPVRFPAGPEDGAADAATRFVLTGFAAASAT